MKRKLLFGFAVLVIAVGTAWNVSITSNEKGLSDISLANVEALAGEGLGCTGDESPFNLSRGICHKLNPEHCPHDAM